MKQKIALTIGDPAGIGPEITLKAAIDPRVKEQCIPIIIGDLSVMEIFKAKCNIDINFECITHPDQVSLDCNNTYVIDVKCLSNDNFELGKISGECGMASFEYIKKAALLALDFSVDAIATAPINKESLKAGKVPYIGHTEILADLAGVKDPLTMFEVDKLRVFFLSRHVSLRQACDLVKKERIIEYVKRSTQALDLMGIKGVMAIAGLNPHSGENGLFGDEEVNEIVPAIKQLQKEGFDVVGPVPADSVFFQALEGRYASVLSLYHDQGHIATKTYAFYRTISITHGMPFLRTSVDHGTAFDIAGQNIADPISMIEAVLLAAKYSRYFVLNSKK